MTRRAVLAIGVAFLLVGCATKRRGGARSDRWPSREIVLSMPLFADNTAFVQATLASSGVWANLGTPLPCVCDHPLLTCVIEGDALGGTATVTLQPPASDWPDHAASLGRCQAGGRVLDVRVEPEIDRAHAYWHNDTRLVVPVHADPNRETRSWDLPLPEGAPADAIAVDGTDGLTCSRPEGLPVVRVTVRTDVVRADAGCLVWDGGAASVHAFGMRGR